MFLMWFFFKGGFMVNDNYSYAIIKEKSIKKLLKPFCWLTMLALFSDFTLYFIDTLTNLRGGGYYSDNEIVKSVGSVILNGSAHGNMPIWFLFSYFAARLLFAKVRGFDKSVLYLIIPICLYVPLFLNYSPIRYPYYIANVLIGLSGYISGYLYKINCRNNRALGFVALLIYFAVYFFYRSELDIRTNTLYSGSYLTWWVWSLSGCIAYLFIFRKLSLLSLIANIMCIDKIGRFSMQILIWHWPILLLADFLRCKFLMINDAHLILYYMGSVAILVYPINYLVKLTKLNNILNC